MIKVRLLLSSLALAAWATPSTAKELKGVYEPTQNPCPSVEEAIAKMKVPDGYEVRNFAAEPTVVNPVAMTWDHRGRLWVVELFEYPSGAKTPNEYSKTATDEKFRPVVKTDANSPRDKVVILEDTDNDGKADKRTVFAEGLNLATAVLCGYGGVFVGQAPNMFFFRDTNGDDKADEYKAVLTGFGLEDRHELLNSFCWGPDGYMYFTHGVFTHSKVRRPGEPDDQGNTLNAGVYRVKFESGGGLQPPSSPEPKDPNDGSKPSPPANGGSKPPLPANDGSKPSPRVTFHEVFADGTSNPWGVDFDARGNAFVEACVIDHLFHMAPGGIYTRQGGAPENPYAYELLPSIVPKDHPRHFRAAYAGIQIYQGGIYPADTHGHVFFGNIHDNAIHEEALEPVGATFKAKPVRDFLRANDGWFRPVSIQTGPDGFLWVMDWCDKYPCYQNAQANPEGVDREKGRIWRVCYTGSDEGKKLTGMSRPEKEMDLRRMSADDIVGIISNDKNNWKRRMARRIVAEKQLEDAVARKLSEPDAAIELLWAQMGTSHFFDRILNAGELGALSNKQSSIFRQWTARVIGETPGLRRRIVLGNPPRSIAGLETLKHLESLAKSTEPEVRLAVAVAVRQTSAGRLTTGGDHYLNHVHDILEALIVTSAPAGDKTLPLLIWQAMEPELSISPAAFLPWLADLAPKTKPLSQVLTYKTARRITDTRSAENIDLLLGFLDTIKADDVLTAHALDGMLKAQEAGALKPAKYDPAPLFAHWRASKADDVRNLAGRLATLWGDESAVADLIKLAEDEKAPADKRVEALRTLRKLKSPAARAAVLRLLEKAGQ